MSNRECTEELFLRDVQGHTMAAQQERLRSVAVSIRTKPTPLSDFIPLLTKTADHIDALEAEIHASDLAVAEYRQQCLDNAQEIARLRAESEERLQNCVALAAENERLRKGEERKPMTDKDIVRIYGLSKSTTDFARNIELFIAEGTP